MQVDDGQGGIKRMEQCGGIVNEEAEAHMLPGDHQLCGAKHLLRQAHVMLSRPAYVESRSRILS